MVVPWILLPLYIYPSLNAWRPLYSAIESNPGVTFRIIVNPNSGPGGPVGSYPDQNYIEGISKLNGYTNTELLGYVSVAWTARSYAAAQADVDAYIGWSQYNQSNLRLDGIFFDESPNSGDSKMLSYLGDLSTYTRQKMAYKAHISLNPGTRVSEKWYDIADSVVAFENYFTNFWSYPLTAFTTKQKYKTVFIIHSFWGTTFSQELLLKALHVTGLISGSFVTTQVNNYDEWSTYWRGYVSSMSTIVKNATSTVANGGGKFAKTANSNAATTSQKSSGKINNSKRETSEVIVERDWRGHARDIGAFKAR